MTTADSPGRTIFGLDGDAPSRRRSSGTRGRGRSRRTVDVGREDDRLAAVEPRALEVGQDVQLLDGLPRADAEVAAPRPSPRRSRCPPADGSSAARRRSAGRRQRVDGAVEQRRPPAASPARPAPTIDAAPRPAARSIGRVAPFRPMLAERSTSTTTRRLPADRLGREQVGPGEQQGDQGHARQPQRQQQPALQPPLPRVVAEHDLEELERPQVDRAGPGGGTSGG